MIKFNSQKILNICSIIGLFLALVSIYQRLIDVDFNNQQQISTTLNYYIKVIQNTAFLVLFYSLFFKYSIKLVSVFLPLAMLEQSVNFFHKVNNLLLDSGFYSLITKYPQSISPEYPRIVTFFIVLIIAIFLLFFKSRRSLPRLFLSIGCFAVFTTSIIFHFAIIWEIDFYKNKSSSVIYSNIKFFDSPDYIDRFCATNKYDCSVIAKENINKDLFNDSLVPQYFKPFEEILLPNILSRPYLKFSATAYPPNIIDRITGQIPVFVVKNPNFLVFVSDKYYYKNLLILNQFIFAYLAFFSHIVWFGGALFLIYFHKKKLQQKASKDEV